MLIKPTADILSSEITPKGVYVNRREFIRAATGTAVAAAAGVLGSAVPALAQAAVHKTKFVGTKKSAFSTTEPVNTWNQITTYNNFYEFGIDKDAPSHNAVNFKTDGWTVAVEGEVKKPAVWHMEDILKGRALEDRIYRHRCVEGWSMVIPWVGFPLSDFIKQCQPTAKAKFLEFISLYDPARMPGQRSPVLKWPYVEGLRMDEAMNPLTILCVGLYGEVLPNQDGAPIRIVMPWKYGFKSAKSIVKIRFTELQPINSWQLSAPNEYGFYANVNPTVDHPRWSQAREVRLPGFYKNLKTQMFNGYGPQVASMYAGMDLKTNF
jgi:sulfoxide reductase catalytic subunit YedY